MGDGIGAAAAQLAIWSIAYGVAPTSFNEGQDPGVTADFNYFTTESFSGAGLAEVLIPTDNWPTNGSASQQMVIGVPEAKTWIMLLAGFGMMGAMGYRKARAAMA